MNPLSLFLSVVVAQTPLVCLTIGTARYAPGRACKLAASLSSERFSRDSKYISFIDENPEGSYASHRQRIAEETSTNERTLVRYTVSSGQREVLYRPAEDETLMRIEPVGSGGDLICSIAVGVPAGENLNWKAIYCPVGGKTKTIVENVSARSFQISSSISERKAFILVCNPDKLTTYYYVSEGSMISKRIPQNAFQGGLFTRSKRGNPIATLQGAPPDYNLLGNYELDFATGEYRKSVPYDKLELEEPQPALLKYEDPSRWNGDPASGESPLSNIFVSSSDPLKGKERLIFAQGVIAVTDVSPDSMGAIYLTADGYFFREMIRLDKRR